MAISIGELQKDFSSNVFLSHFSTVFQAKKKDRKKDRRKSEQPLEANIDMSDTIKN